MDVMSLLKKVPCGDRDRGFAHVQYARASARL
jgi:hypothetical protein